ncbi:DUF4215 domain-containing protein [Candidatus Parabeggiatoa sp. HSG14]|uniref:DUF4215 domain-containing protein n=1 Tax=Candidatus Parabeggiatoa sp. HSG14 TaxID=3055593 RepID=UPI0025A6B38D|nr:DUF4215 domain-containing protein [Thiotrichales bacterium HSG14]
MSIDNYNIKVPIWNIRRFFNCLLSLALLMLTSVVSAQQSSDNYTMLKNVLSNGGNKSSSANYQLVATVGQNATRKSTANDKVLYSGFYALMGTQPPTEDTDNDGLPDEWETYFFGDLTQDGNADSDGDGVSNLLEFQENLNPTSVDTDGDGKPDNLTTVAPTQASCQLYAVNDKGLNNSQFFTINLDDLTISELGQIYKGHDIEAIAIHPETDMIYVASGDNVTNGKKGFFYQVDGKTGELFSIGSTGFKEIEDLAFDSDGTLWAWAKGDGLITIEPTTGIGTLALPSNVSVEGLTLSKQTNQTIFYGSINTELWLYDMNANKLEIVCTNLFGETESLEMMSNGQLLVGTHNVPFGLHAFNPQTCQAIMADETLSNKFNDVEGIALPIAACSVCGDSVVQGNEQCDDGNTTSGDLCSDICMIE